MAEPLKCERCPVCGSDEPYEKHGTYVLDGRTGTSVFDNATWQQCAYCGSEIMFPQLISRVEDKQRGK